MITHTSGSQRFGRFEISPSQRSLWVDGVPAMLGSRAFDLLLSLYERRDRVVPKHDLIELVWPGLVVEENNLQVQISTLRKLLGPQAIATIPGRGYQFTAALDDAAAASEKPSTLDLPTAALASVAGNAHAAPKAPPPTTAPPSNLPESLSTLYGRDEDVAALVALIKTHLLVTVVGAGGIGKTRLAQAAAHRLRDAWTDGAWLVELAPCSDPELVPSFIAQALSVKLAGAKTAQEEIVAALRPQRLLLVLDNCEHLLGSCAVLATAVLAQAPGVTLLATSQEPLHLADEQQFRLQPLAVPAGAAEANAREAGAVALFAARAHSADPRFELNAKNIAAVIEICRRLDGIALAIELAAARVPLLGVDGVRTRLDDRFHVLTAGARVALRRHQTLRATVEWSHSLLIADEQAVLRRLGVFVGGFGLSSAQYVATDERIDEWAALDHLGALVDKSLVVAETSTEPRYRLLETTRAFALEKLHEHGETAGTLRRHAEAIRAVFERSMDEIWIVPSQVHLPRYQPELDNLRAALDWAAANPDGSSSETLIALTGASIWLWAATGLTPEGVRRYVAANDCVDDATPPNLEARLHWGLTDLNRSGARRDEFLACERAISLYRAQNDKKGHYLALGKRVEWLARRGDLALSERALSEAEKLLDASWPPLLRSRVLFAKVHFLWRSDRIDDAKRFSEESHQLLTAAGDVSGQLYSLMFLQVVALTRGKPEEAVARGHELLKLCRNWHFPGVLAAALHNLSAALTELGQLDEALSSARECVPLLTRDGELLLGLAFFARLAFKRDHPQEAALTLGCIDAIYAEIGQLMQPYVRRVRDETWVGLQSVFSKTELKRLLAEGAALTAEEAARIALAD